MGSLWDKIIGLEARLGELEENVRMLKQYIGGYVRCTRCNEISDIADVTWGRDVVMCSKCWPVSEKGSR